MTVNSCSNGSSSVCHICFLMMMLLLLMMMLMFHLQICLVLLILLVSGFIWNEIKQMWDSGFQGYIDDWWNLMDFIMNSLYIATISLKIIAYVKVLYNLEGRVISQHSKHVIKIIRQSILFHSTVCRNPEATGKCGTRPWWQSRCLLLPTSLARCDSSASSPPTHIWAHCRSHWAACFWTSSSSFSSTGWCC